MARAAALSTSASAAPSITLSARRRCWVPSCRSCSSRRRSEMPASTMRWREARTSFSWACKRRLQMVVLQGERACGDRRLDEIFMGESTGSASTTARRLPGTRQHRPHQAVLAAHGMLDGGPVAINISVHIRHPVEDVEAGIVQHPAQSFGDGARLVRSADLDEEIGNPGPREAALQDGDHERRRHAGQQERLDRVDRVHRGRRCRCGQPRSARLTWRRSRPPRRRLSAW